MHQSRQLSEHGFIALLSAVIISFILIAMTFTVSTSGYYARFNQLNSEEKRVSLGLAESCVNVALLRVAANYAYNPGASGETVPVGLDTCLIKSVNYSAEDPVTHRKTASIATQADYQGAFSNMKVSASVQNPAYSPHSRATLNIITHVINNSGGTKQASDATVNIPVATNPSATSFAGSETGTVVLLDAGSYNVTENPLPGYTVSASTECSSPPAINLGDTKTCVLTQDDIPTTAQLSAVVNVKNDNGGTKTVSDFHLKIDSIDVNSGQPITVSPGSHTVTATGVSGYIASPWGGHCATDGSITLSSGENKSCVIVFDDIPPPAPSCADTVIMLDRTGSMFTNPAWIPDEKTAAKAFLDLYATLVPHPQVGIGRFADSSGNSADIIGQLTSSYGGSGSTGATTVKYPTVTGSPSMWSNPTHAFANDTQFANDTVLGEQQAYGGFGFSLPSGATISGIEVVVDGKASGSTPQNTPTIAATTVGNYNSWTGSPTNTNAGKVSAVAANDGDTSFISSAVSGNAETYLFGNAGVPAGSTVNSVTLVAVAKGSGAGAAASIKLRAEKGTGVGQQSDDAAHPLTTSYGAVNRPMNTNPLTGAAWTLAEVNAWTTRFGVVRANASGLTPRVTQLYLIINYTPPTVSGSVDVVLSSNTGASWTAAKSATFNPTESAVTLGGTSDVWGRSWTGSDLSDGPFLLRVENRTSGGGVDLNYVTVKAYYTVPISGLYGAIETGISSQSGGTNLADAISVANTELNSVRHQAGKEKVLIIISDGMATRPSGNASAAALTSADTAKLGGTKIFGIHFGDVNGRNFLAQLSGGSYFYSGHQPGSQNNAGTSMTQSLVDAENTDGDNFFISPTSASMQSVFQSVGKIVCPAVASPAPAPPTKATIIVTTHVVNDNGGTKIPGNFSVNVSATNPSMFSFAGVDSPGQSVTVDPGPFTIDELAVGGYSKNLAGCSGSALAGDVLSCTITNDDVPSSPPPPPPPPPDITIGPWEQPPTSIP